jgi:hypothetical protein
MVVRVDWVTLKVEERIYDLSIGLTPTEPPSGTIIWGAVIRWRRSTWIRSSSKSGSFRARDWVRFVAGA